MYLLNRRSVLIDGCVFLGCMLWTDFQLPVFIDGRRQTHVAQSLRMANEVMADYQYIQVKAPAVRESLTT